MKKSFVLGALGLVGVFGIALGFGAGNRGPEDVERRVVVLERTVVDLEKRLARLEQARSSTPTGLPGDVPAKSPGGGKDKAPLGDAPGKSAGGGKDKGPAGDAPAKSAPSARRDWHDPANWNNLIGLSQAEIEARFGWPTDRTTHTFNLLPHEVWKYGDVARIEFSMDKRVMEITLPPALSGGGPARPASDAPSKSGGGGKDKAPPGDVSTKSGGSGKDKGPAGDAPAKSAPSARRDWHDPANWNNLIGLSQAEIEARFGWPTDRTTHTFNLLPHEVWKYGDVARIEFSMDKHVVSVMPPPAPPPK